MNCVWTEKRYCHENKIKKEKDVEIEMFRYRREGNGGSVMHSYVSCSANTLLPNSSITHLNNIVGLHHIPL